MRATADFDADSRSVGDARRFLRRTISSWGAEDLEFEASLVVSELVSNSVIHARTPLTVAVEFVDGLLTVAVTDGSPRPPRRKSHGVDAATGRGLALVDACSRSWGVETHQDGKTVWAVLRSGSPRAAGTAGTDGSSHAGDTSPGGADPTPGPGWQLRSARRALRAA